MPKALCIAGMVVAAMVFLVFFLDFLLGFFLVRWAPFRGASMMTDIVFILCSAALGYLSWSTYKEQV